MSCPIGEKGHTVRFTAFKYVQERNISLSLEPAVDQDSQPLCISERTPYCGSSANSCTGAYCEPLG